MEHVGARTETKIALHKSTVEDLLLYREKNVRREIGMELNTGEEAGDREGKGNWGSKLFSNNGDLRRPTFENLPLVKEQFFSSCGVLGQFQLCWNVAPVCSSVVSAEQK